MSEYWDIYDMNRNKTTRTHLRGEPIPDGDYHLVVQIWVCNSQGKVLMTQRHPDIPFGLKWSCTGGSVLAGEEPLAAAVRETREETGILLHPQELILLGQERRLHSFLDTFVAFRDVSDCEIVMQPEEVVDFRWVNEEEYHEMEAQGILHPALKNFYETYRPMLQRLRTNGRQK